VLLETACAAAGRPVAVVDPKTPAAMLDRGFDGRTSAIAYGSRLVFDGIGLWPAIAAEAEPIATPFLVESGTLVQTKEGAEAQRIARALEKHNNNRLRAAAELGISRMTLYKKLHRYGLMFGT